MKMKLFYTFIFIIASVATGYADGVLVERSYFEYFQDGQRRFDSCNYNKAYYNFFAAYQKSTNEAERKKALEWRDRSKLCWLHRDTADYFFNHDKLDSAFFHYSVVANLNKNDEHCVSYLRLCYDKWKSALNDMVEIQGGTFTMGDNQGLPDEKPAHIVKLDNFCMDTHEVTNFEYVIFLNATGSDKDGEGNLKINLKNPNCKIKCIKGVFYVESGFENSPVAVSWYGAESYAVWAGKSLPSEAQWEYVFNIAKTYGVEAMDSSLSEWCEDWYAPYSKEKQKNPVPIESSDYKVYRGCGDVSAMKTKRNFSFPSSCQETIGFRCVVKK